MVNGLSKSVGESRELIIKFFIQSMKKVYTKGPANVKVVFRTDRIDVFVRGFLLEFEKILLKECGEKAKKNLSAMRAMVFKSKRDKIKKRLTEILGMDVCVSVHRFNFEEDAIELRIFPNTAASCDGCMHKFCNDFLLNDDHIYCK